MSVTGKYYAARQLMVRFGKKCKDITKAMGTKQRLLSFVLTVGPSAILTGAVGTGNLIEDLPAMPSDYLMRDWREVAQEYHRVVTDFDATGDYLPVVWWDTNRINYDIDIPFVPSFVGIPQGGDALNLFPTVVGSTLVGLDMSDVDGHDWVRSMKQFQGLSAGRVVLGNNKDRQRSTGLWYDLMPGVYFFQMVDLYPELAQVITPFSGMTQPSDFVVSFTGEYFQDFSGLHSTTRSAELLPVENAPHLLMETPFGGATGMEGWYVRNLASPALPYRVYGLSGVGSGYVNFGIGDERALGGISNGSTARPIFGVVFRNDTGQILDGVDINFIGEEWRASGSGDRLVFSYRVSSVASIDEIDEIVGDDDLVEENPYIEPGGGFNLVGSTSLTGIVNGHLEGRVPNLGGHIADLGWEPGEYLVLRWSNESAGAGFAVGEIAVTVPGSPASDFSPMTDNPDSEIEGFSMVDAMYSTADKWYEVLDFLGGSHNGYADFTGVVGFNTVTMEIDDRGGTHPGVLESAAGMLWMQYMAYRQFGEERFLTGAQWAANYLEEVERNPMHNGMQMGYGALAMARMNAELDFNYDVDQMFRWIFGEGDPLRNGWGVLYGFYGEYEVSGLIGTEGERGGANRAYAKQGFNLAGTLVPMVRYDSRFAKSVGKWVLHKASSSRHYYQGFLDEESRDSPFWEGDPNSVVPYESLRGDKPRSYFEQYLSFIDNSPQSNQEVRSKVQAAVENPPPMWASGRSGAVNGGLGLCTYFGGDVGYLGAILDTTDVEMVLRLNLLATDFFRDPAYPTYLYYNPHDTAVTVTMDLGEDYLNLYDAVTHQFVMENVSGNQPLVIPPSEAMVIVHAPADGEMSVNGRRLLVNDVVIDYFRNGVYDQLVDYWSWAAELPGGFQGPSQDPFGSGAPNLLRFVFGSDPTAPLVTQEMVSATSEGVRFSVNLRENAFVRPMISSDLQDWQNAYDVPGATVTTSAKPEGRIELRVDPPSHWPSSFIRFELSP